MTGVVWEDPPTKAPHNGQAVKFYPLFETLKTRPGQWGRVAAYASASAARTQVMRIRRRATAVPPGHWDVVSRSLPDGGTGVYARFLGLEDRP